VGRVRYNVRHHLIRRKESFCRARWQDAEGAKGGLAVLKLSGKKDLRLRCSENDGLIKASLTGEQTTSCAVRLFVFAMQQLAGLPCSREGEMAMADLKYPDDVKYARSDEWVRLEGDTATIGISDYAQDALNDVVYVELPSVGDRFEQGQSFGSVESVKAASDLYAQVGGEVIEVNSALEDEPELINSDAYGRGWLIKLRVTGTPDVSHLLDAAAYKDYCATR
jgi:glycine cleavage system H protein